MVIGNKYQNLYETLVDTAKKYSNKIGVIDDISEITYGELLEEVDRFALFLYSKHCVSKSDTVAIMINSSIRFIIAFYALMKLGAVSVLINTKLKTPRILSILEDTKCKILILDENYKEQYSQLDIISIVAYRSLPFFLYDITEFDKNNIVMACQKNIDAVIMYTSGSTGLPKGALITHDNILNTSYGYKEILNLTADDISLLSVPIFHILGLSCVSTLFIYLGATLILQEIFNAEEILDKIQKYKVTHFHSAPVVFIKLNMAYQTHHDLSSLHYAICGGAFISGRNRDIFCSNAVNANFRLAYGMTETSGSGMLSKGHKKPLSAVNNVAIKIVDRNFDEVSVGELGQIIISGPVVINSYFKMSQKTGFLEDWIITGDIGRKLIDGNYEICDREKDIVNRGGEKVSPLLVESVISSYPNISQTVVVSMPDDIYGEVPIAAIEISSEGINMEDLLNFLKDNLAKYEMPVGVYVLPYFEYTDTGKVDKIVMRNILIKKHGEK